MLLKEAGWKLDHARDREFEVQGMPNNQGAGYVDYVLWGDDGKPLAVVEAKDAKHSVGAGMPQAIQYAELLGVPFSFASNGDGFVFRDATLADGVLDLTVGQPRLL